MVREVSSRTNDYAAPPPHRHCVAQAIIIEGPSRRGRLNPGPARLALAVTKVVVGHKGQADPSGARGDRAGRRDAANGNESGADRRGDAEVGTKRHTVEETSSYSRPGGGGRRHAFDLGYPAPTSVPTPRRYRDLEDA